jgi:hypothetical protein
LDFSSAGSIFTLTKSIGGFDSFSLPFSPVTVNKHYVAAEINCTISTHGVTRQIEIYGLFCFFFLRLNFSAIFQIILSLTYIKTTTVGLISQNIGQSEREKELESKNTAKINS